MHQQRYDGESESLEDDVDNAGQITRVQSLHHLQTNIPAYR